MAAHIRQACQRNLFRLRELVFIMNLSKYVRLQRVSTFYRPMCTTIRSVTSSRELCNKGKTNGQNRAFHFNVGGAIRSAPYTPNSRSRSHRLPRASFSSGGAQLSNNESAHKRSKTVSPRLLRIKERLRLRESDRDHPPVSDSKQNANNSNNQLPKPSQQIEKLKKKFPFLSNQPLLDQEAVFETSFGTMRFDNDNKPGFRDISSSENIDYNDSSIETTIVLTEQDSEFHEDFFGIEQHHNTTFRSDAVNASLLGKHENEKLDLKQTKISEVGDPINLADHEIKSGFHENINSYDSHIRNLSLESMTNVSNEQVATEQQSHIFDQQYFSGGEIHENKVCNESAGSAMDNLSHQNSLFDEQYFVTAPSNSNCENLPKLLDKEVNYQANTFYQQDFQKPQNTFDRESDGGKPSHKREAEFVAQYKKDIGRELNIFEDQFLSQSPSTDRDTDMTPMSAVQNEHISADTQPRRSTHETEVDVYDGVTRPRRSMDETKVDVYDGVTRPRRSMDETEVDVYDGVTRPRRSMDETEMDVYDGVTQPRRSTHETDVDVYDGITRPRRSMDETEVDIYDGVMRPRRSMHETDVDVYDGVTRPRGSIDETDVDVYDGVTEHIRKRKKAAQVIANVDDPQTAYDAVMKMRLAARASQHSSHDNDDEGLAETGAAGGNEPAHAGLVDSKGFRILKNQVLDVQNMTSDVVTNILCNSILCNHEDVLAIDKPYGLPSHGGPGVHLSVAKLLPLVAKRLSGGGPVEKLHLVHRLDKETTGVFLIARNQSAASRLSGMFSRGEIIKKYWALTKGTPSPRQGIIDIPMAESRVASHYRMALVPERTERTRALLKPRDVDTIRAVSQYQVLDEHNSVALVEITPETGVKHQIRCHLAFGMNTPILGDHKYSHLTKIAPQRLYPETLQRLGIRQSKVRHVPMHLHSRSIVIPEFNSGRNMFIRAHLPKHFLKNMKRLQIKPPKL